MKKARGMGMVRRTGLATVAAMVVSVVSVVAGPNAVTGAATGSSGDGLLRVTTDPAVPSQISVDGLERDTWSLDWLKIAPGSHEVCFSDVPGFATPECETVTVSAESTSTVAGEFADYGSLQVRTSPAVAGRISVDGTPRDNWGLDVDLEPGSHEVCFDDAEGFVAPECEMVTLAAGTTISVTGTYQAAPSATGPADTGMLRVTTDPPVPSRISVDDIPRNAWGLDWLQIQPGPHEVCFSDIPGFSTPECETVTVTAGHTSTVNGAFTEQAMIQVVTDPAAPSTISIDGTARDDWGVYTAIAPGSHEICFDAAPGWNPPPCRIVTLEPGTNPTITAGPETIDDPEPIGAAIAAGENHSCALHDDGTISCWGSNDFGQLGDGTGRDSSVPVDVVGIDDATAISGSGYHACALHADGAVSCWGSGYDGELGDGTEESSPIPVGVTGIDDAIAVAAGMFYSCAVHADGAVSCWGDNWFGQLGDGADESSTIPVGVSGIDDAIAVAAGQHHSCAVHADGSVSCWGTNAAGGLGDGTTDDSVTPVGVSGIVDAIAVSVGEYHSCAVHADGAVSCWGANWFGQLGDGTTDDSAIPVGVSGIVDATVVAAGRAHSCAVHADGAVSCWGTNTAGKLGDGTTDDSAIPVGVTGIVDAIAVAAGIGHSCAVHADGAVSCWGGNFYGQLGNGTTGSASTPVGVMGIP